MSPGRSGEAAGAKSRDAGGTVSVSTMEIFAVTILPPILRDLRAAHPGIHIHLDTSDEPRDLSSGATDIAIRSSKQPTGAGLVGRRIADNFAGVHHEDTVGEAEDFGGTGGHRPQDRCEH